jgi:hypothetical protein
MKNQLNEIKRMQYIAGIKSSLNEGKEYEYQYWGLW